MKIFAKITIAFGAILLLFGPAFPEASIIIESRFFKGTRLASVSQEEIVISSLSEPFIVPVQISDIENEKLSVESMQRELQNLYQMRRVDHLVSANMIWDGIKKDLTKTILLEGFQLPICFSPEIVSEQSANLRVRVSQLTGGGMMGTSGRTPVGRDKSGWAESGPMEASPPEISVRELLDTEITLNFNQPVVLGFPIEETSYFLEVLINNRKGAGDLSGASDKYEEFGELDETMADFLQPPTPVWELRPLYPEQCKKRNIEGAVILQVGIDVEGNVIDVELLKSAHRDLDQSAVDALRQWKYQPVKKEGEPVPVTFTVTVDFKLRNKNIDSKNDTNTQGSELERILSGCADYCDKLTNAALHFICEERISEEINHGRSGGVVSVMTSGDGSIRMSSGGGRDIERNEYIYDYQLINKDNKIEESRVLLKENGKKKNEKDAPIKTKRFYSKRSVYGPIGWLGKEQQDKYTYRILKEQTVKRRKCYVIEVEPKTQIEENPNHGRVWIDKEDFSVLRIEIIQESLSGYEKVEQESSKLKLTPRITTTHDYFFEKNGIRFPSGTICEEMYLGRPRIRFQASETTITYDAYRFFTVETKVIY